jgi:phosphoribosyl 1,2-cyclic phosphate phosphodiesterase
MKITILGSGSAYGSPQVSGFAGSCDLKNKKNFRLRSSFYLEDKKDNLYVECGPDFREQTLKYNISEINNLFVSHGHFDHIGGVGDLVCWAAKKKNIINIYGSIETLEEIKIRFPYMFNDKLKEIKKKQLALTVVKEEEFFYPVGTMMKLLPLSYTHSNLRSFGFRYKDFVFTPDLEYIPNSTRTYLEDMDLWLVECNDLENSYNNHNYLEQSIKWFEKYKPKRMVLNHLDVSIDYESVSKMLPSGIELAFDGMILEL